MTEYVLWGMKLDHAGGMWIKLFRGTKRECKKESIRRKDAGWNVAIALKGCTPMEKDIV